ncbi:uncharacterized protein F5891DRAFT_272802 [Suillus fuscotomentosus]|uniref:Uncharacterized protein n=1 Tax=Suillus fuscotomentosus TaxID=1912939 RepID=A0AAD4E9M9_9AGAM|nr:uncharacterized protein F5891DRAFT_272802 [Suillus fuscotomentosus]KAG1900903.1 hypothetical protein F5891DRAFT_272802 [Suillus fuscotomentosus]
MNSDAARHPPIQVRRIPPAFFDGVHNGAQSSAAHGTHHCSPARSTRAPLLERLSSLFHHSHWNTDGATELQRRPRRSIFSRGPRIVDVATVQDRKVFHTFICNHTGSIILFRHCMLLRGHDSSSKGRCMARARRNLSLPPPPPPHLPHLIKVLALPHQVQQPRSHHLSHCGFVSYCFFAAYLPRTSMVINIGAVYVQSSYPSRLLLFHQPCFLVMRLVLSC